MNVHDSFMNAHDSFMNTHDRFMNYGGRFMNYGGMFMSDGGRFMSDGGRFMSDSVKFLKNYKGPENSGPFKQILCEYQRTLIALTKSSPANLPLYLQWVRWKIYTG